MNESNFEIINNHYFLIFYSYNIQYMYLLFIMEIIQKATLIDDDLAKCNSHLLPLILSISFGAECKTVLMKLFSGKRRSRKHN